MAGEVGRIKRPFGETKTPHQLGRLVSYSFTFAASLSCFAAAALLFTVPGHELRY